MNIGLYLFLRYLTEYVLSGQLCSALSVSGMYMRAYV